MLSTIITIITLILICISFIWFLPLSKNTYDIDYLKNNSILSEQIEAYSIDEAKTIFKNNYKNCKLLSIEKNLIKSYKGKGFK